MVPFMARKVNYQELSSNDDEVLQLPSRRRTFSYFFSIFLALGWAVTLFLYWQLSISTRQPVLPIPPEVFTKRTKVFHHDDYWSGMSEETQSHWDAPFAGHGALWVEHPEKYNLPKGIVAEYDHPHKQEIDEPRFFVVSKLHEVHCLSWIRLHWWTAVTGGNLSGLENESGQGVFAVHIGHCFEYLRQAIMCGGGDIVLEGYSPLSKHDTVATSVSGWGRAHQCIDFEALANYQIEQEAKYNLTWQAMG